MKRLSLAFIGIISGLFLGAFLWVVQIITTKNVYTLLINVDYIPVLKEWNMHPITELVLHLIVSVIVVFLLYAIFKRWNMQYRVLPYVLANGVIGVLLYGTTAFSTRTPDLLDYFAIFCWILGHLLYGVIVGIFLQKLERMPS
ncbi:hypothetical protein [Oceanobacillus picturae]|jgi:hypothetical protein|uniref:hypothetical protein n=1 Tax=Oceanobacillus picturae TaxID=171693 RepID=UPI0036339A7A